MTKRKRLVLVVLLLLLVGLVAAIGWLVSSDANGTIIKTEAKPTVEATVNQRVGITGTYASFSYPTKFIRQPSDQVNLPVLERYNFRKQQVSAWQVAITVTRLDTGLLSDDGTYNYRQETPGRFSKDKLTFGRNSVTVFTDKTSDVFAQVAYLQKGTLSASIAMTGGTVSNLDQLQTDFNALVASWQWR